MFIVSHARLTKPREPDKRYVVNVCDMEGNLIFWAGPLTIRERDKLKSIFRKA